VDSLGLPIRVLVHPANLSDKEGGLSVLKRLPCPSRLSEVRVDQGFDSPVLARWCEQVLGAELSVTQRDPTQKGFVVQRGRWVVERTFAWLGRYRRLSKDYEHCVQMSESFVYAAALHLLVRRLCR
jgi:putative transposase